MLDIPEGWVTIGVDVVLLDGAESARREPRVTGVGALFVPSTGIVDYTRITTALAEEIRAAGGQVVLGAGIDAINETDDAVAVAGPSGAWAASTPVVCAALQARLMVPIA